MASTGRSPREPYITRDNRYFWDGVQRAELLIQRCSDCGRLRHPSRPMCVACHSLAWAPVPSSGRGTVYSFVVFHHPKLDGYDPPYVVAVIELDEGVRMVSQLIGVEVAQVRIGMAVSVAYESFDDVTLPVFQPRI